MAITVQVLAGSPEYHATGGSASFKGQDLLGLHPEERGRLGLFLRYHLAWQGRRGRQVGSLCPTYKVQLRSLLHSAALPRLPTQLPGARGGAGSGGCRLSVGCGERAAAGHWGQGAGYAGALLLGHAKGVHAVQAFSNVYWVPPN